MWSCSPADLYYTHPLHGIAAYSQSWLCDKDTLGLQAYATTTSNRSSTPGRQNWMQNLGETCSHQPEEFGECCLSDMGARTCRWGGKWVGRPGGKRGRFTIPKRGRYRHEFSIPATSTVHFTEMAKGIWKYGTKQTSQNCKFVSEMLSWSTQLKDTSWSFETSTKSNPPIEAQQTIFIWR